MFKRLVIIAAITLTLAACDDDSSSISEFRADNAVYSAQVTRTEYGIPHILADDWGSLGYGYGYAYAQDNFCVVMREVVLASGRSAELMGEAEGDLNSDFLFRFLYGDDDEKIAWLAGLSAEAQAIGAGYAAGLNRYLEETGLANLPEGDAGCRDAPWVQPIRPIDLYTYLRRIALGGSSDQGLVKAGYAAVTGPDNATASNKTNVTGTMQQVAVNSVMQTSARGSNALALGGDITQNGKGMLLGNPHQPWQGSGRWYQAHLTIPDVIDVAGASLQGLPWIGIGFNQDVAWTHTVSFASRFTLYELKLNPDNPLQYQYDGEMRDIDPVIIEANVQDANGNIETRTRTFYVSHFGPIINLGGLNPLLDGWPLNASKSFNLPPSLLALRDANIDTGARSFEFWRAAGQATSLDEFIEATKNIGNPVFHTLAADRHGDAFYGEISAVPHVTQQQLDTCVETLGQLLADLTGNAVITLDGSRSACEWGEDADSPPGTNLFGFEARPKITTRDYVANSNNSHWLSDANNPLTGFPLVFGWLGYENEQQFLRTRLGHLMVAERKKAIDGLDDTPGFSLLNLQGLMYANEVYAAQLVLDDVLAICSDMASLANPTYIPAIQACAALAQWDRKVNLDSSGAQVFTEFWAAIRATQVSDGSSVVDRADFWAIDFDPVDPLNTPSGIDRSLAANDILVLDALNTAVQRLTDNNVSLDEPWQNVQFLQRNGVPIPIHGGDGNMGVYGDIKVNLSDGGYKNPTGGNSYIQTVTWDESECPIAEVILTHSQSTDPASPYYGDQTELYADKQWLRMPFCDDEIAAAQVAEPITITNQ